MFNIICQQPSNLGMSTPKVSKDFPRNSRHREFYVLIFLLKCYMGSTFYLSHLPFFHFKKKEILIPNVAMEDCPRELKKKNKKGNFMVTKK